MELTKLSPMPSGKFEGMQMQDVPPAYLVEITSYPWSEKKYPEIVKYVDEHREEFQKSEAQPLNNFLKGKNTTQKLNPKV